MAKINYNLLAKAWEMARGKPDKTFNVAALKSVYEVTHGKQSGVTGSKAINTELLKKAWDESKHPRADNGQFGSGGGGDTGGKPADKKPKDKKPEQPKPQFKPSWTDSHPDVAFDDSGNPEYIQHASFLPPKPNPAFQGTPSGKVPSHAPDPYSAEDGVAAATAHNAANPKTPKPAGKQPPKWTEQRRQPGVDDDGYMDYASMDDSASTAKAKKLSNAHTKALSNEQKTSVTTYTGSDYSKINRGLRSDNPSPEYEAVTAHMDNAINQSELPENTVLYRGMYVDDKLAKKIKPGKTITDKAYWSTSLSHPVADGFTNEANGAVMRIKAPKGQRGLAVESISNFPQEKEILLPRNTKYKITSVFQDPDTGKMFVDAEIVGD
jgi:hypothetical protein